MIKFTKEIDLSDYNLIIPTVSVGNVAQLSVDLLITTLNLQKIGYLWHGNIVPAVAQAQGDKTITTACELFASEQLKCVVLQIRSSFGKFSTIRDMLMKLCKSVRTVTILTGSYAYERKDIHLVQEKAQLKYHCSEEFRKLDAAKLPEHWKSLETKSTVDETDVIKVPGSGIGDHLYAECLKEKLAVLLVVEFVSEGDNRSDAHSMASFLDESLTLRQRAGVSLQEWKAPSAWDYVFGNTFPGSIF